jgi:SAM-dependent methyltransferase
MGSVVSKRGNAYSDMHRIKSKLKKLLRGVLYAPTVRKSVEKLPGIRQIYPSTQRTHPIDRAYGIETSCSFGAEELTRDKRLVPLINPYFGSQPSIVRRALKTLPDIEEYTFIDLGCGKGRATIIASEFPFLRIIGVELSPALAAIARKNAATVERRFPGRPPITVVQSNILEFELPPGKLVFFNYNAFGETIHALLLTKLEASLASGTPHLFVVSYNPVQAPQLDASPAFRRYFAGQFPYDASELGFAFGPDADDAVIIWQSVRGAVCTPFDNVDAKVIVSRGRATIANSTSWR